MRSSRCWEVGADVHSGRGGQMFPRRCCLAPPGTPCTWLCIALVSVALSSFSHGRWLVSTDLWSHVSVPSQSRRGGSQSAWHREHGASVPFVTGVVRTLKVCSCGHFQVHDTVCSLQSPWCTFRPGDLFLLEVKVCTFDL